jgi:hypothetical protein
MADRRPIPGAVRALCRAFPEVEEFESHGSPNYRALSGEACLPSAVRVRLGSLEIVRVRFAAAAAFFTLRRAAADCFELAMTTPRG